MIANSGKGNFLAAHYDWVVAGVGALALVGAAVFYVMALGEDPDEMAAAEAAGIDRLKPASVGVKPVDMSGYQAATRLTRSPVVVAEIPEKTESFLASERRIKCTCGKAISGDVKAVPVCPFCGAKQEEEKVVVLDADGDGMPDEWEKKYGFNPNDPSDANLDKDSDAFTNLEEYMAKTDPTDAKDHPDYLDSLAIQLPLKETYLPFVFTKANKIPSGWRLEFFDPSRKDNYGRKGMTITATIDGEVEKYGYVVRKYEEKSEKRERKGMKGMMVSVDVSEVTLERKSDKKVIKLVIAPSKKNVKPVPVDVQVTLAYTRGGTKNFDVVPGDEIDLSGTKYRIVEIKAVGKGAKVTVANALSGQKRTIQALEQ